MLKASELILSAYNNNTIWMATVYGKLGIGKSAYCLKVAYEIYRELEYSNDEAWSLALDSLVFKPIELVELIDDKDKERVPVVILDDASFHLGSSLYRENSVIYNNLKKIITTIRTRTGGLLINAPSVFELAKFLRGVNYNQISITKHRGYQRYVKGYTWSTIQRRTGPRDIMRKSWQAEFSCYIPNEYYKRYIKKRNSYLDEPIEEIKRRSINNE